MKSPPENDTRLHTHSVPANLRRRMYSTSLRRAGRPPLALGDEAGQAVAQTCPSPGEFLAHKVSTLRY